MPRTPPIRICQHSSSSPLLPNKSAVLGTGRVYDQGQIDGALKKRFRALHHYNASDFERKCHHSDHDGTCKGAVYMYHGGNSSLFGDEGERTPVCDASHPNFYYLGTFFFWCKTHEVWGGWLSQPLLGVEQLEQDDVVQLWLERRRVLVRRLAAARSDAGWESSTLSSPSSADTSATRRCKASGRSASSQHWTKVKCESRCAPKGGNDVIEIVSSDEEQVSGETTLEPVTVLFWQKDDRAPVLLQLDGPSNRIGDVLGLFDQYQVYELYIPETVSWAKIQAETEVIVHQGKCIALKSVAVQKLKQWDFHLGELSDSLLEYL